MLRVRIELPDQPGSLARVTWTLGVLGADIAQISVLDRDGGRATDDIALEWHGQPRSRLLSALQSTPGVRPLGIWSARRTPEAAPEIDVVTQMVAAPARAQSTLVHGLPLVLAADWAAMTDGSGTVAIASADAPAHVPLPLIRPARASTETYEGRLARAPLPGGDVLTVARTEGPPFHRTEVGNLQRLLAVLEALG
ncbi:MAG: amino acid-binding protein [Actinomycetota bacterium]